MRKVSELFWRDAQLVAPASGATTAEREVLQDRRIECGTLNRLLEGVRAGRSGTLVVRGEPGVGWV